VLALVAQVVFGFTAPETGVRLRPDQKLAVLLADPGAICHGDPGGGQPAPHHHGIDCLLCPYCAAIGTVAALRSDDPKLPIPRAGPIAVAVVASQPVSQPPPHLLAAQPRGPPILA
jgi:hypothetical protein